MTYLDIRYDRMADGWRGAPRRVWAIYGDYRTVEGLQILSSSRRGRVGHERRTRCRSKTVVLNAPLDDSSFETGGRIRAIDGG